MIETEGFYQILYLPVIFPPVWWVGEEMSSALSFRDIQHLRVNFTINASLEIIVHIKIGL